MKLIIISGLSGSGKTIALHTLEDAGFYAMDNIPSALLPALVETLQHRQKKEYAQVAVGVDARSSIEDLKKFPTYLEALAGTGDEPIDAHIIFLEASDPVLIKRFSATRRKHPLSQEDLPLVDAIKKERDLLSVVRERADLIIDTTRKNEHELRKQIQDQLTHKDSNTVSILFQSFGFKHGVPADSDFVFDVRCLPNPHWSPELRHLTGKDKAVAAFLEQQAVTGEMIESISHFLDQWLSRFSKENRRYLTLSIGCTGGQHRSVYLCEKLSDIFQSQDYKIAVRHRELP